MKVAGCPADDVFKFCILHAQITPWKMCAMSHEKLPQQNIWFYWFTTIKSLCFHLIKRFHLSICTTWLIFYWFLKYEIGYDHMKKSETSINHSGFHYPCGALFCSLKLHLPQLRVEAYVLASNFLDTTLDMKNIHLFIFFTKHVVPIHIST